MKDNVNLAKQCKNKLLYPLLKNPESKTYIFANVSVCICLLKCINETTTTKHLEILPSISFIHSREFCKITLFMLIYLLVISSTIQLILFQNSFTCIEVWSKFLQIITEKLPLIFTLKFLQIRFWLIFTFTYTKVIFCKNCL